MKRLFASLLLCSLSTGAQAVCTGGTLPFQLQNNTLADATQVMANFNSILTSVAATCASNGANNDITSINNLTTPIGPINGGSTVYVSGVATGTNSIVISFTVPANFTLTAGYRVTWISGGSNTGAANINVNGTGVKNLFRRTNIGSVATAGGEIINGNSYEAVYDGTEFILQGETIYIGEYKDWSTTAAPPGYLIADGSAVSQATFAGLFAVIGLTYGNPGGGNFNLPDTRGRVMTGLDSYGTSTGAANRLTNAATGCGTFFSALPVTCPNGNQSHTLAAFELPSHTHQQQAPINVTSQWGTIGSGGSGWSGNTTAATDGCAASTGTAHPIDNPNYGVVKIIRF